MTLKNVQWFLKFTLLFIFIIPFGCEEDLSERDRYKAPSWLKGKIYSQIVEENTSGGDLNTFIELLNRSKYDTLLNTSGSFTVFAPTDGAFELFFQEHPLYSSIEDLDSTLINAIVKYQIIYNAWSVEQFKTIDVGGWVSSKHNTRGYKHKSLYRPENMSYPVQNGRIVPAGESNTVKKVYSNANKYCPVFFQDFFYINNLSLSDYEVFFDRFFESDQLFFAGAKLDTDHIIPAENGFIYKTDRVVFPLPNAEELLESGYEDHSYKIFLSLIHDFADFKTNIEATNNQPGAEAGLDVDTLYNLTYPGLEFDIHNELTGNKNNASNTIRYLHGILAPTDEAFDRFIGEYIPGGNVNSIRTSVKRILINTHMAQNAVYQSNISQGFRNGEGDLVEIGDDRIIQKTYGSNCTFIGLNEVITPRIFSSILRPLYFTTDYEILRLAVEETGLLPALKKVNLDYAFYLPADNHIGLGADSSLIAETNPQTGNVTFFVFDRSGESQNLSILPKSELRKQILNQIAVRTPRGISNKEFLRNLGGNFIIIDNGLNTASGSAPTTYGYNGGTLIDITPELSLDYTDNGKVYEVETFFSFGLNSWFSLLNQSRYTKFKELLTKCGLYDPGSYELTFVNDEELHTVFIPSEQALIENGLDTLPVNELEKLLKYHFVRGDMIFTDGEKLEGDYTTKRIDESSTRYSLVYNTLRIRPGADIIEIIDKEGNTYVEIPEVENETNIMIRYDADKDSNSKWDFITTHVVHNIDKVLLKSDLQYDY